MSPTEWYEMLLLKSSLSQYNLIAVNHWNTRLQILFFLYRKVVNALKGRVKNLPKVSLNSGQCDVQHLSQYLFSVIH